jgi:hypothetical protein
LENKSVGMPESDKKEVKKDDGGLLSTGWNLLGMAYEKTVSAAENMKDQVSELEITKKIVDVSGKTVDVLKETSNTIVTKGSEIVKDTTKIVVDKSSEVAVKVYLK